MNGLVEEVIEAHGGLASWQRYKTVSADLVQGGALWALKGQAGLLDRTTVTVGLRDASASHTPFGAAALRSRFTPERVVIENTDGRTIDALDDPRHSFADHTLETPWTAPQLAYFAGCAMWTYLNMPFLLVWPGVICEELTAWDVNGERWRRVRVNLPGSIFSHSPVQTLHIGKNGLLRRHDYDVEITGGTPAAHFVGGYVEVSGIRFPTRRRIYPRRPDGSAASKPLVVSIDLAGITLC